jgi:hypothetical protein
MPAFVLQRVMGGGSRNITNCAPRPLINTAWVEATNFQPPISNGGRIDVVEESSASGFVPPRRRTRGWPGARSRRSARPPSSAASSWPRAGAFDQVADVSRVPNG